MAAKSIRRGLLTGLTTGALALTAVPAVSASTGTVAAPGTTSAANVHTVAPRQLHGETATLRARHGGRWIVCRVHVRDPHRYGDRHDRYDRYNRHDRYDRYDRYDRPNGWDRHDRGYGRHDRVRSVAHVRCNRRVRRIHLRMYMHDGDHRGHWSGRSTRHSRHLYYATTYSCHRHRTYRSRVHVRVHFPHRYHPRRSSVVLRGHAFRVHKCR